MKKAKNFKLKLIIILTIFILNIILVKGADAKYVIEIEKPIYRINSGDKIPPTIIGNNEEVRKEYSENVTIEYFDNIVIDEALVWYSLEQNFEGQGSQSYSGQVFTEDGYYHIEVSDLVGNKSEATFLIDKTSPVVNVTYYKETEEVPIRDAEITPARNITESLEYITITSGDVSDISLEDIEEDKAAEVLEKNKIETMDLSSTSISTMSIINVEVSNFSSLKYYLEVESSNSYQIYLTSDIVVTGCINVSGEKAIIGQGHYLSNAITNPNDLNKTMLYVKEKSNLKLYNLNFNGNEVGTSSPNNIAIEGVTHVYDCNFSYGGQGIHVLAKGKLFFYSGNIFNNSLYGIGSCGTVYIEGGNIFDNQQQGIHNNGGTLNISGGNIYDNNQIGILNFSNATSTITNCNIYGNARGIQNESMLNLKGGNIHDNTRGIRNTGTMTMTGGNIYNNTSATGSAIYQSGTLCTITGGTIEADQNIYLATDNSYITTNTSYPTFTVRPNSYSRGRILIKTAGVSCAETEIQNITLYPNDNWHTRVIGSNICLWDKGFITVKYMNNNGNVIETYTAEGFVGDTYTTIEKEYAGFMLVETASNNTGIITETETIVIYVYRNIRNLALVTYYDVLSGVDISNAKYWYNPNEAVFDDDGTLFESGTSFTDYGYYRILVIDKLGNITEKIFELNQETIGDTTVISEQDLESTEIITPFVEIECTNEEKEPPELQAIPEGEMIIHNGDNIEEGSDNIIIDTQERENILR